MVPPHVFRAPVVQSAIAVLGLLQTAAGSTIHLCGDSTMAKTASGSNTQGWGEYLRYSFDSSFPIVNHAIGGRSSRSFTREGRFDTVAGQVQAGDWVVIEFGHNDGGSLSTDNGRSVCYGAGSETCQTVYNGVAETVLTFPAYYKKAAQQFLNKGAKVIMSSATPNNVWESGSYAWGPSRFDYYAWIGGSELGGTKAGIYHVPHGYYAAQAMKNLGGSTVNAGYPNDHTHTGPYMADVMARSFVLGLKCGTSGLGQAAKNSTGSLTSTFLGPCIQFNGTVPI
jgi:rhamnogalacturonan acetylesterase